jgi:hypothetical protein
MSKVELLDIDRIDKRIREVFRYRTMKALSIDGKAPALDKLLEWKKSSPEDYRGIVEGIKMMCFNRVIPKTPRLVNCVGYSGLVEIKAPRKNARLFCFVDYPGTSNEELVICTGAFWKTNDKKNTIQKQNDAMKEAYRQRAFYLKSKREV